MDRNDRKYVLKKLMHDALTDAERSALNAAEAVEARMLSQWETAPDAAEADRADGADIWQRVLRRIERGSGDGAYFYKVYSAVASVLLLLAIGGAAFMALDMKENVPMYVVSSGIQNMQQVTLPDGTNVQLGPSSRLTYPSRFVGRTREVKLDGQAFFDVHKDPRKPFIVRASDMDIQALGTAFEVFDYEIENKLEAILLSGKVKVGIGDDGGGKKKECILQPNQRLQYDRQTNTVSVQTLDADKYTAWRKQGILSFENEKLSMIIPRLEQWYGRKAICPQDLAEKYRFTFKVRDESLERILFMMKQSSPLTYKEIEGGNYKIMHK